MKNPHIVIFISTLLLLLTACGNSNNAYMTESTLYFNEEFGFSIEIPDGYEVELNDSSEVQTVFPISEVNSPKRDTYLSIFQEFKSENSVKGTEPLVLSEDVITINGLDGLKRTLLEFNDPIGEPDGLQCTNYDFYSNDTKYSFSTHACKESDIIWEVISSFEIY